MEEQKQETNRKDEINDLITVLVRLIIERKLKYDYIEEIIDTLNTPCLHCLYHFDPKCRRYFVISGCEDFVFSGFEG